VVEDFVFEPRMLDLLFLRSIASLQERHEVYHVYYSNCNQVLSRRMEAYNGVDITRSRVNPQFWIRGDSSELF
jgi:hypothetical protein